MANKYLISGATYCGDGTASNEAASNGAAGAWNDLAIFQNNNASTATTPAYGALAAGDIVYIRSKTSGGADLLVSMAAKLYLGSQVATETAPITWILDNGAVWSGVDGKLEFDSSTSYNYTLVVRNHNRIVSLTQDAMWLDFNIADPVGATPLSAGIGCYVKGFLVDNNEKTGGYACIIYTNGATFENLHFKHGKLSQQALAVSGASPGGGVFINPWIELTYTAVPENNTGALFLIDQTSNRGGDLTVIGGKVTGAPASQGYAKLAQFGTSTYSGHMDFYGFNYPKQMPTLAVPPAMQSVHINVIGADSGYGSFFGGAFGQLDSRNLTYNYPVLNATMPDTEATPWSWKGYPSGARMYLPLKVPISKFYTSSAASKTVTLEMLVANTFDSSALDKAEIWMTVTYVNNADDSVVTETTRLNVRGTVLDTSTASWNTTSWGAVSLLKRKLSLTTSNAIKQNTLVTTALFWTVPSGSSGDVFFVCPDVQLT